MVFSKISKCVLVSLLLASSLKAEDNKSYAPLVDTVAQTKGPELANGWCAPNGYDVGLSLSVLYWHPKLDGTYFTYTVANSEAAIPLQGAVDELPFKWNWGIQAGIFMDTRYDGWKLEGEYTSFAENTSRHVFAGLNNVLVPLKGYSGLVSDASTLYSCTQASSSFKLNYQTLVADLTKAFFVSKRVLFSPFLGLEAAWINLKQSSMFAGGENDPDDATIVGLGANNVKVRDQTNFAGVGPYIGIYSKWYLYKGFSIFGDADFSYVFGRYKIKHNENYSADSTRTIDLTMSIRRLNPTAHIGMGLVYDTYLNKDLNYLSISLGYDTTYWWQIYRPIVVASVGNVTPTLPGNLHLYGVTLKATLEF